MKESQVQQACFHLGPRGQSQSPNLDNIHYATWSMSREWRSLKVDGEAWRSLEVDGTMIIFLNRTNLTSVKVSRASITAPSLLLAQLFFIIRCPNRDKILLRIRVRSRPCELDIPFIWPHTSKLKPVTPLSFMRHRNSRLNRNIPRTFADVLNCSRLFMYMGHLCVQCLSSPKPISDSQNRDSFPRAKLR